MKARWWCSNARSAHIDCRVARGRQFSKVPIEIIIKSSPKVTMRLFVPLCTLISLCTAQVLYTEVNQEVNQKTGLGHVRETRQAQQTNYRPYSQAPAQIKNLLQYQQAREPIVNIPQQAVPQLTPGQGNQGGPQVQTVAPGTGYRPNVQFGQAPQQPTYKNSQHPAYNPQQSAYNSQQPAPYAPQQQANLPQQQAYAPQQPAYRPLPQQPAAPAYNPQYQPQAAAYKPQPISGPQGEQRPNYSKNIPPEIQQLIQAQQNQQG
ncbi:calcium-binding protein P-like isoform X2 [Belonocnema kinseyi]|uniref:calcium-binding protein P-like isoform X2 n=1 Tax=Belonocnema kinseyi TaxID=2817044 RepID=UPI00143CF007|nr:calcium-binding protein P-like isoform X2 [Belonocnema kinseyi]